MVVALAGICAVTDGGNASATNAAVMAIKCEIPAFSMGTFARRARNALPGYIGSTGRPSLATASHHRTDAGDRVGVAVLPPQEMTDEKTKPVDAHDTIRHLPQPRSACGAACESLLYDMTTNAIEPGTDTLLKSYNDVLYTSFPDPARHPDRLATIGTLLGLDVAPTATCRVLEFACGDGTNLVPIAATLPNASFVGFDFATRPIAHARSMARDLGLTNIHLLELDLRQLPADLGSFDYVIAHGFYSWIPAEVRVHLMPLIARHLAPNGVALVSYNTLPGCHMRRAVWDMIKYHTRDIADARHRRLRLPARCSNSWVSRSAAKTLDSTPCARKFAMRPRAPTPPWRMTTLANRTTPCISTNSWLTRRARV